MVEADLLIQPDRLAGMLQQAPPTLIDVRGRDEWLRTRLPGAVHLDPARFNRRDGDAVGLLPSEAAFNQIASELGLHADRPVVVYDDKAGPPAGRATWTLLAFGHPRVSMLDGGIRRWLERDYPVEKDAPETTAEPGTGTFQGRPVVSRITDAEAILQRLGSPELQIVDTRSAAEYHGEDVRSRRGGHIPGAVNLDWNATKDASDDSRFKNRDELNAMLAELGLDRGKETVCYCQSHQRSALLCVLLESLDFENVKGYPGAWSDWGNRDDTPVEK